MQPSAVKPILACLINPILLPVAGSLSISFTGYLDCIMDKIP